MKTEKKQISEPTFIHLNVHSHYSLFDGMCRMPELIARAKEAGMYTMALTDHGGMFGIKDFLDTVRRVNARRAADEPEFKPIVGLDAYCARRSMHDNDSELWEQDPVTGEKRLVDVGGFRLTLLAKNRQGYRSLCKLATMSYTDGLFNGIPRIDRSLLAEYKDGLIVCSGGVDGELSQLILKGDIARAEHVASWFKEQFGEDYYIELMRHKTDNPNANLAIYRCQMKVEPELVRIARKLSVKLVATNDVHFVSEEHGEVHDGFVCIASKKDFDDPGRMRYTKQEWLKSPEEMRSLFADLPEVLETTMEIADKVEEYSIYKAPQWPATPIPDELSENIKTEDEYLEYLVWEGARKRYGKGLNEAVKERIALELNVIKEKGIAGYFLLIWNIVRAAREELGISMGPGCGLAPSSVVVYCLYITNIDPLRFGLLFERFYDRRCKALPIIIIDIDRHGEDMVVKWLKDKYGENSAVHIGRYSTYPKKYEWSAQDIEKLPEATADAFKKFGWEGMNRMASVNSCMIAVASHDISDNVPLCVRETYYKRKVFATQYDYAQFAGHNIEDVGLVNIRYNDNRCCRAIRDCASSIRKVRGEEIDIDSIPLDDELTYKLFSEGNTVGVFLFEYEWLRERLRELKTNSFDDIMAMNALCNIFCKYEIPEYIDRKHGRKSITYQLPEMEECLRSTYGIIVYQEQLMLLCQKLAGFTPGQSNRLCRAVGCRRMDVVDSFKIQFIVGGRSKGYPKETLAVIWDEFIEKWRIASCKSHILCNTWQAYQMAYLKVHYPVEFMTSLISHAKARGDELSLEALVRDCQATGLPV